MAEDLLDRDAFAPRPPDDRYELTSPAFMITSYNIWIGIFIILSGAKIASKLCRDCPSAEPAHRRGSSRSARAHSPGAEWDFPRSAVLPASCGSRYLDDGRHRRHRWETTGSTRAGRAPGELRDHAPRRSRDARTEHLVLDRRRGQIGRVRGTPRMSGHLKVGSATDGALKQSTPMAKTWIGGRSPTDRNTGRSGSWMCRRPPANRWPGSHASTPKGSPRRIRSDPTDG
jgi:hypothetical protein